MNGDEGFDATCPVEIMCRACSTAFWDRAEADAHLELNPGHDLGPCGQVLHPRVLMVRADNGPFVSRRGRQMTPQYVVRQALRQHLYNSHSGLSPRRVSLFLDRAMAAIEGTAAPPPGALECAPVAGSPGPDRSRPLAEAHGDGRAATPTVELPPIKVMRRTSNSRK